MSIVAPPSVLPAGAILRKLAILLVRTRRSGTHRAVRGARRADDFLDGVHHGKRYRTIARRIGPEPGAYRVRRHARLALPDLDHSRGRRIIVALIVAAGFRSGDERQLRLLYNRPYPFAVSDVLATVLYCIAVSLLSSLLNAAILVVMLSTRAATDVPHGYGYYHTSEGDGVRRGHGTESAISRPCPRSVTCQSLAVILLLLVVSLSGVLKVVHADMVLPTIGGKSFAFGRDDEAGSFRWPHPQSS